MLAIDLTRSELIEDGIEYFTELDKLHPHPSKVVGHIILLAEDNDTEGVKMLFESQNWSEYNEITTLEALCAALMRIKCFREALEIYEVLCKSGMNINESMINRRELFVQLGMIDELSKSFPVVERVEQLSLDEAYYLAEYFFLRAQYNDAFGVCIQIPNNGSFKLIFQKIRIMYYGRIEGLSSLMSKFEKILSKDPRYQLYHILIEYRMGKINLDEGIVEIEKLSHTHSDNEEIQYELLNLYEEANMDEGIEKQVMLLLSLNEDHYYALFKKALIEGEKKNFEEALRLWKLVLKKNPYNEIAIQRKALTEGQLDLYEEGIETLESMLKAINSVNLEHKVNAYVQLATFYDQLGKNKESQEYVNLISESNTDLL